MVKSYTEELAAWVEKRTEKKRRQDAAAVAFMAVKSDVVAAMEAGYALTTIWEHMHETGKVKCSYETFRKHVHRFTRSPPVTPSMPAPSPPSIMPKGGDTKLEAKGAASSSKPETPKKSEAPKIGGFVFDATPKKEELL